MGLSINHKNNKSKPAPKTFKQLYQESKDRPLTKKEKRGWLIFGAALLSIPIISSAAAAADQSNLERDNVPIVISEIDNEIAMDYHTNSRELGAKISGISQLAKVKVADEDVSVGEYKDHTGTIKHQVKDIAEGDSKVTISVQDGKRHNKRTITLKRQTKADYDKQELEKALKRAEESIKKAESDPSDENIAAVKSDIEKLPEDKRQPFAERIATLEKTKQEEKEKREREEKAQKEAEEQKRKAEEAAAAARQQQSQQQVPAQQPQAEIYFRNCTEAKNAGYSNIPRGAPGYRSALDRDGDGIACDK